MPPWHVQENKWRAARYGLDAIVILDADSNERLVTEDLDDLLARPVAESLHCAEELAKSSPKFPKHGRPISVSAGAAKEHGSDLRAVVDSMIGELDI